MGATKLLYNFYMVFPVLFSIFFCGETLTLPILLGIVCMAGVTVLSVPRDKDPDPNRLKKDIFRWFIVTLLATASNGVLTIVKRSLSWQFPEADTASFTFWGFAFAAVICWSVVIVFKWRKQDFSTWTAHPRLMARFVLAVALSTALASLFQMLSLETVPGVVVFPLTSGGVLLLLEQGGFADTNRTVQLHCLQRRCGRNAPAVIPFIPDFRSSSNPHNVQTTDVLQWIG